MPDANLTGFMTDLNVHDVGSALESEGETLDSLAEAVLADRVALMARLRRHGVPLRQQQTVANELSRWARSLPLLVRADCGLCNRLRVVCSYRDEAQQRDGEVLVAWEPCEECPGRFDDVFAALSGVSFVHDARSARPLQIELGQIANDFHPRIKGNAELEAACLADLQPNADVAAEVKRVVARCGGARSFLAMHVRRTDHYALEIGDFKRNEEFDDFIHRHSQNGDGRDPLIYLATDCAFTQRHFAERYADRLLVCERIESAVDNTSAVHYDQGDELPQEPLRKTSLRIAVVDLLVCVEAQHFCGSTRSTFSDTIDRLRLARGLRAATDEHTHKEPPREAECVTSRRAIEAAGLAHLSGLAARRVARDSCIAPSAAAPPVATSQADGAAAGAVGAVAPLPAGVLASPVPINGKAVLTRTGAASLVPVAVADGDVGEADEALSADPLFGAEEFGPQVFGVHRGELEYLLSGCTPEHAPIRIVQVYGGDVGHGGEAVYLWNSAVALARAWWSAAGHEGSGLPPVTGARVLEVIACHFCSAGNRAQPSRTFALRGPAAACTLPPVPFVLTACDAAIQSPCDSCALDAMLSSAAAPCSWAQVLACAP